MVIAKSQSENGRSVMGDVNQFGHLSDTTVPTPGADFILATPPTRAMRFTIEPRIPSRARGTRSNLKPRAVVDNLDANYRGGR